MLLPTPLSASPSRRAPLVVRRGDWRGRARRTDLEARHRRPPRPADAFPARGPCTDIHRGGKMLGSAPLWRRRGWWRGRHAGESRRAGRWCHQHRTTLWGPRRTASPRLSDGRPASSTQPAFRSGANPPEGHLGLSISSRPLICPVGITQEWIPRTRASCPTLGSTRTRDRVRNRSKTCTCTSAVPD